MFFSNCNLNCIYCQNYEISQEGKGKEIEIEEMADKFLELQELGANNINLVTPTIYAKQIIEAIKIAKNNGLKIPIIYNSNGYENIETLKKLKGYIDVYLPDLKYFENNLGKKLSRIDNYFEVATLAIKEMYNQVGTPVLDDNGIIKNGLIIRHLILPGYIENSKKVLEWIKNNMDSKTYISVMTQYFPTYKAYEDSNITKTLSIDEYIEIEKYIEKLNFENGYLQEFTCEDESKYVPKF